MRGSRMAAGRIGISDICSPGKLQICCRPGIDQRGSPACALLLHRAGALVRCRWWGQCTVADTASRGKRRIRRGAPHLGRGVL